MKILITAGGTLTPIDQVRRITNIFNGRTGVEIARHLVENDNDVMVLIKKKSSYLEYLYEYIPPGNCREFSTYDDLYSLMEEEIDFDFWEIKMSDIPDGVVGEQIEPLLPIINDGQEQIGLKKVE